MLLPVLLIKPDESSLLYKVKAILIFGFLLWFFLAAQPNTASRLEYYTRTFYALFFALYFMTNPWRNRIRQVVLYVIALHLFLYGKTVDYYIDTYHYSKEVNVLKFPYISVFDQADFHTYAHFVRDLDLVEQDLSR